jgi:tRNA (cmo5U34)-methyltransferase
MSNSNNRDEIFAGTMLPGDFVFDAKVANVFEDMINRSIPGYSTIITMIGVLAERYCQANSTIYDLGCSLGGASFAVLNRIQREDIELIAVDNSKAMIEKLTEAVTVNIKNPWKLSCQCEDILDTDISNASVVILNFTLQFIPVEQRAELLKKVFAGMRVGGILIISDKITFPDEKLNQLFIEMYHSFKENMGYSKLEIARKRAALENVLLPETLETHKTRLTQIGFRSFDAWFQCFNFASMVAFK